MVEYMEEYDEQCGLLVKKIDKLFKFAENEDTSDADK